MGEEKKQWKHNDGLVPKQAEAAVSNDLIKNNTTLYSSLSQKWMFPFFMAGANVPIVHTTAENLGYGVSQGHGFTYGEYWLTSDGSGTVFAFSIATIVYAWTIGGQPVLPAVVCILTIALYFF